MSSSYDGASCMRRALVVVLSRSAGTLYDLLLFFVVVSVFVVFRRSLIGLGFGVFVFVSFCVASFSSRSFKVKP